MPELTLKQRIEKNLLKNPHRTNLIIAKNLKTTVDVVEEVRQAITALAVTSAFPTDMPTPITGGVTLSTRRVSPRKPPESAAKYLKRLPKGRGFSLKELSLQWGMAEESVKRHARELGCFKYVEVTEDEWVPMVMHPDTAAQYQ